MNIFFEGPKNQNSSLGRSADGLHNLLAAVLLRNSEIKFMLAYMSSLTNCENLEQSLEGGGGSSEVYRGEALHGHISSKG
jgi:hypothetical protein